MAELPEADAADRRADAIVWRATKPKERKPFRELTLARQHAVMDTDRRRAGKRILPRVRVCVCVWCAVCVCVCDCVCACVCVYIHACVCLCVCVCV